MSGPGPDKVSLGRGADRKQRSAEALRDNLRRRKDQQRQRAERARSEGGPDVPTASRDDRSRDR